MIEKQIRETYILEALATVGFLSVAALARDLGVSEVTIRSNLRELEGRGLLLRTHGGARASSYQTVLERQRMHVAEKERIAAAASAMVRDGDTIMIEGGTTTALLTKCLTTRRDVQIVTNSLLTVAGARLNRRIRLLMTGGEFHHETESFVGGEVLEVLRRYNVRVAFVGASAFSLERGLTTRFPTTANIMRMMRDVAEETWLLADSSKFGRADFVTAVPLEELSGVITDGGIEAGAATAMRELGLGVVLA